ncbi:hypothetical protein GIB67_010579 [Kingdonia uniflora]|uniref:Uncharacterized protein n=1 Tax=Kingdonia uniflora TaxID=39325 RepID=A0A7J7MAT3_9MAGN|nr:hypothetical protein GIB67_010579 [Kingdonia uniflora]
MLQLLVSVRFMPVELHVYWFYEYCGVGHLIVKEEVKYYIDHRTVETITWEPWFDFAVSETEEVLNAKLLSRKRIPLQVPSENCEYYLGDRCWRQVTGEFVVGEERETYASYWAEQTLEVGHMLTDSQRMGNLDLFGPSPLRAGTTPVVVTSASVHSLFQDFSLPDEAEGPDLGGAVTPNPWYAATRPCRVCAGHTEAPLQEVEEELAIARKKIDNIDHQLYANDLQLRMGRDVQVMPLPYGGGTRTRQRGSGPRTRGCSTSRRGRGTEDDSE